MVRVEEYKYADILDSFEQTEANFLNLLYNILKKFDLI